MWWTFNLSIYWCKGVFNSIIMDLSSYHAFLSLRIISNYLPFFVIVSVLRMTCLWIIKKHELLHFPLYRVCLKNNSHKSHNNSVELLYIIGPLKHSLFIYVNVHKVSFFLYQLFIVINIHEQMNDQMTKDLDKSAGSIRHLTETPMDDSKSFKSDKSAGLS